VTTEAQRQHAAQHRVATTHHSFDVEAWADNGVIVREADDESPVLMLRDRDEWAHLSNAISHALACPARPSETPIVPTADEDGRG
jgi:hypothetical protein